MLYLLPSLTDNLSHICKKDKNKNKREWQKKLNKWSNGFQSKVWLLKHQSTDFVKHIFWQLLKV